MLLAVCLLVARWIGVSRAGYSVAEEAPVFVMVFGIPAALALVRWWIWSRA